MEWHNFSEKKPLDGTFIWVFTEDKGIALVFVNKFLNPIDNVSWLIYQVFQKESPNLLREDRIVKWMPVELAMPAIPMDDENV
jgi:hypothetical protein